MGDTSSSNCAATSEVTKNADNPWEITKGVA
jgi:hypothetical protein